MTANANRDRLELTDQADWYPEGMGRQLTFNVQEYGATGSGVIDDTWAFQEAANLSDANGGVFYVPSGVYKVTAPITWSPGVRNGIMIRGDGESSRILSASPCDVFSITKQDNNNGLSIRDLLIETSPGQAAGAAVRIKGSMSDVRLENISVFNTYNGFQVEGTNSGWTFRADGCYVTAGNYAVYSQGAFNAWASQFWGGSAGVVLDSASNARLFGVGVGGPMCVLTRNTQGQNVGELVFNDVETNNVGGTAPPEGWGGFALDYSSGPIHLTNCFCENGGVSFGGSVTPYTVNILGGTYQPAYSGHGSPTPAGAQMMNSAINMQGGAYAISVTGATFTGTQDQVRDDITIGPSNQLITITGNNFIGLRRYCINSQQAISCGIIMGNNFGGFATTPLNLAHSGLYKVWP